MQLRREKYLDSISDINIDIYLIGYKEQGESIVFILYANKPNYKVLYSIVIDCYEENINATKEILDEILTDKVDMLIWTHPHDDHTKGMLELLNNYSSRNTQIILANILGNKGIKLSKECKKVERKIATLNKRLKYRYDINEMVHFDNSLKIIEFLNADTIERMDVRCIAPIPSISAKQSSKSNINPNDLCVAIIVELVLKNNRKMNFLFSGDIENEVLSEIHRWQDSYEIPNTYNFIKIPHHGGRSAEKVKGILNGERKSEYAATTIFLKEGETKYTNPEIELLEEYKGYVDNIGCTSDIVNKKFGLGMLRINYSLQLYATKQQYTIDTFGSAIERVI